MPMSEHLRAVRAKVGNDLLVLPAVTGLVFDGAGRVLRQHHGDTLRSGGDESLALEWFARDAALTLDLAPWARIVLPAAFDRPHGAFPSVTWRP